MEARSGDPGVYARPGLWAGVGGLKGQPRQGGCKMRNMFAGAAGDFERHSLRRQDFPQDIENGIAIAGDGGSEEARIDHGAPSLSDPVETAA